MIQKIIQLLTSINDHLASIRELLSWEADHHSGEQVIQRRS